MQWPFLKFPCSIENIINLFINLKQDNFHQALLTILGHQYFQSKKLATIFSFLKRPKNNVYSLVFHSIIKII